MVHIRTAAGLRRLRYPPSDRRARAPAANAILYANAAERGCSDAYLMMGVRPLCGIEA